MRLWLVVVFCHSLGPDLGAGHTEINYELYPLSVNEKKYLYTFIRNYLSTRGYETPSVILSILLKIYTKNE
ncbi:hypothetical protein AX774_g6596 [Zancudomyces culisetae]|uniref:Uncharacterized protein n=1 Tax=Zancudomyces culisetae TaxID=1213189 RepID=A0A1R1PG71_ZANCU|nr:hypothetical protein AX774_g6596 [Zancudomyces culisetae]|eukprot:OMH79980.1 hypothetical protein AX774_g6596 [Zancudomyces culisetae]